jgi:hypothetical protein
VDASYTGTRIGGLTTIARTSVNDRQLIEYATGYGIELSVGLMLRQSNGQ